MAELQVQIDDAVNEYHEAYVPYLQHQRELMAKRKDELAVKQLAELKSGGAEKAMRKPNYNAHDEDDDEDMAELEKLRTLLKK
jgi:hypothetical protein